MRRCAFRVLAWFQVFRCHNPTDTTLKSSDLDPVPTYTVKSQPIFERAMLRHDELILRHDPAGEGGPVANNADSRNGLKCDTRVKTASDRSRGNTARGFSVRVPSLTWQKTGYATQESFGPLSGKLKLFLPPALPCAIVEVELQLPIIQSNHTSLWDRDSAVDARTWRQTSTEQHSNFVKVRMRMPAFKGRSRSTMRYHIRQAHACAILSVANRSGYSRFGRFGSMGCAASRLLSIHEYRTHDLKLSMGSNRSCIDR